MREYLDLLRTYPDYRNLWLAREVSNLGDWFNLLASAALIASLTNSGTAVSLLFLARYLPTFFATPYAGVLADRVNRRNILIAADLLRALTVICFLLVRDPSQIWLFYTLTALQFSLSALYNPAHSALLANTVPPNRLVAANTLDSATWSTMLAVGALLGGIATALFGVRAAFMIDSASFVLAGALVLRISADAGRQHDERRLVSGETVAGIPEPAEGALQPLPAGAAADSTAPTEMAALTQAREGMWASFVSGLQYLRLRPLLLGLALVKAGGSLVWGAINVLEISLANDRFPIDGSGTLTLALIYAVVGVGTGLGPIVMRQISGDAPSRLIRAIGVGFVSMTVGVLWMGLAGGLGGALGGVALRAIGVGIFWVFSESLLLGWVEDAYRGRVLAFQWTVFTLAEVVSILFAGFALDQLGWDVQQALLAMGALGIVVTGVWLLFELRVRRSNVLATMSTA
jgi:MFS family permease